MLRPESWTYLGLIDLREIRRCVEMDVWDKCTRTRRGYLEATSVYFPIDISRSRQLGIDEDHSRIPAKSAVLSWLSAADACYDLISANGEVGVHARLRTGLCARSCSYFIGHSPCWVCVGEGCNGFENAEQICDPLHCRLVRSTRRECG